MDKKLSLRERKRRDTRIKIEDTATRLVDERGFANVTVEEICEAAGISKRTFFNYFDSKDSAALGPVNSPLSSTERDYFLTTPTDDLLEFTVEALKHHWGKGQENAEIVTRRHRIAIDPDAAAAALNRKRARTDEFINLVVQRLDQEPRLRRLPQVSPHTEAIIISGLLREAFWLACTRPDVDDDQPIPERVDEALKQITAFVRGTSND